MGSVPLNMWILFTFHFICPLLAASTRRKRPRSTKIAWKPAVNDGQHIQEKPPANMQTTHHAAGFRTPGPIKHKNKLPAHAGPKSERPGPFHQPSIHPSIQPFRIHCVFLVLVHPSTETCFAQAKTRVFTEHSSTEPLCRRCQPPLVWLLYAQTPTSIEREWERTKKQSAFYDHTNGYKNIVLAHSAHISHKPSSGSLAQQQQGRRS